MTFSFYVNKCLATGHGRDYVAYIISFYSTFSHPLSSPFSFFVHHAAIGAMVSWLSDSHGSLSYIGLMWHMEPNDSLGCACPLTRLG